MTNDTPPITGLHAVLVARVKAVRPEFEDEDASAVVDAILGATTVEHGILWGDDGPLPHIYTGKDHSAGLLKKYGKPGDKHVSRVTSGWITEEEL